MRAPRGVQDSRIKVRRNYQTVPLNLNTLGPYGTLLLEADDCACVCVCRRSLGSAAGFHSDFVQSAAGPHSSGRRV